MVALIMKVENHWWGIINIMPAVTAYKSVREIQRGGVSSLHVAWPKAVIILLIDLRILEGQLSGKYHALTI